MRLLPVSRTGAPICADFGRRCHRCLGSKLSRQHWRNLLHPAVEPKAAQQRQNGRSVQHHPRLPVKLRQSHPKWSAANMAFVPNVVKRWSSERDRVASFSAVLVFQSAGLRVPCPNRRGAIFKAYRSIIGRIRREGCAASWKIRLTAG